MKNFTFHKFLSILGMLLLFCSGAMAQVGATPVAQVTSTSVPLPSISPTIRATATAVTTRTATAVPTRTSTTVPTRTATNVPTITPTPEPTETPLCEIASASSAGTSGYDAVSAAIALYTSDAQSCSTDDPKVCDFDASGMCQTQGTCEKGSCISDPEKKWSCAVESTFKGCEELCKDMGPLRDTCEKACASVTKDADNDWKVSIAAVCECMSDSERKKREDEKRKNDKKCNDKNGDEVKICAGKRVLGKCVGKELPYGTFKCSC